MRRVNLNSFGWSHENLPTSPDLPNLNDLIHIDLEEKIIDLSSKILPLPCNMLYSFSQDLFDEVGFMQYPVPMSASTPDQYNFINDWKLAPDLAHAALWIEMDVYGGTTFWGPPLDQSGSSKPPYKRIFSLDNETYRNAQEAPCVPISDYIILAENLQAS